MKKNIIIISVLSILVLVASVGYAIFNKSGKEKVFASDGYILEGKTDEGKEKEIQFFKGGSKYSEGVSDTLKFTNTEGEKVTVDKNNFLHYTNKDLSTTVKGVLMDTSTLTAEPVTYSTPKFALIKKAATGYEMENLDEMIPINDYIWKISDDKYVVVSDEITLEIGKDKKEKIENYIELSYVEGGIVKLSNDQYNYQTISNNSKLRLKNGASINLDNKDISINDEVKTNLGRMVIDSNDNIEITQSNIKNNKEETNSKDNQENNNNNTNNSENNNNNNNNSNTNTNDVGNGTGNGTGNGGNIQNSGGNNESTKPEDSNDENAGVVKFVDPIFKFTKFEVGPIGFKSSLEITDTEDVLTDDTKVNVYESTSNKLVYSKVEPEGSYSFDISSESLKPNTDYLIQVSGSYQFNGEKYSKVFLEKQFKTDSIGLKYEKHSVTMDSISVKVTAAADTKISSAKLSISNEDGTKIDSESINIEKAKDGQIITFTGLEKNKKYVITVEDMLYDDSLMVKKFEDGIVIQTLREKPEIGKPTVSINKRNSTFELGLENITNPYNGIEGVRYELYEAKDLDNPISVIDKNSYSKVEIAVDNIKIFRNTNYTFRVLVEYFDNEKVVEYSSEFADTFSMEGVEFPTIGNFEPKELQFEKIVGELFINDPEKTISNSATVYYEIIGDSVGDRYEGSQPANRRGDQVVLNIDQKGLRSNESYTIMVYADVNLRDGNLDVIKSYVGSKSVRTKVPKYLKVSAGNNKPDADSRFNFNLKLESADPNVDTEYEANAMQSIVFNLYEGSSTSGKLIKSVTVRDSKPDDNVNEIKDKFYDGEAEITTEFFGVVSEALEADEYTIEVKNVYDYTVFPNEIPLDLNTNTITIKANAKVPELPDKDDALDIVVKKNDEVLDTRDELAPDTEVEIRAKAKIDNSEKAIKNIIYEVYEASTGTLVKEQKVEIGPDGVIDFVEFKIQDGTAGSTVDLDDIRRGNTYYLAFKAEFDLDGNGDVDHTVPNYGEMLRSPNIELKKQNPKITMTPREVKQSTKPDTNRLDLNIKYLDVDNIIYKERILVKGTNTSSYIDLKHITSGANNPKTGWAENLYNEVLKLSIETRSLKTDLVDTITVIDEFLFETLVNMDNMSFTTKTPGNFVEFSIQGTDEQLKKIIYVDAIITSKNDSTKVKTIENITPNLTGIIQIPFYELKDFKNEKVEVEIKAYYDSNNLGLKAQGTANDYYSLQIKSNNTKPGEYLVLDEVGNVQVSDHSYGSVYRLNIGDKFKFRNKIKIENAEPSTGGFFDKEYDYSNSTLAYLVQGMFQGTVTDNTEILVKKIEVKNITSNTNTFDVPDIIVPNIEVDLSDISLTEANVGFKIDENGADKLDRGSNLKVELYDFNKYFEDIAQGNQNPQPEKTISISKDVGKVKIDNLLIGNKYFIKFYGNINGKEYALGDVFTYELGKMYDFTTLKDVDPADLRTSVESKSESERYAVFKYNLGKISGINRVSYELMDESGNDLGILIEDDDIDKGSTIKENMEKRVKLDPAKFSLGKNYKIRISIYAKESQNSAEKRVGLTTFDFVLLPLRDPVFTLTYNTDKDKNGKIFADLNLLGADVDYAVKDSKYSLIVTEQGTGIEKLRKDDIPTKIKQVFKLEGLKANTSYVAKVVAYVDILADGNYVKYEKTLNFKTVNDYGVSVGDISLIKNEIFDNKIDIFFENTTNLTTIKRIKYTIYSSDGKVVANREEEFKPVTSSLGTGVFTHTIGSELANPDIYNIQIKFLSDKNEIIDDYSGKYVYKK